LQVESHFINALKPMFSGIAYLGDARGDSGDRNG